MSAKAKSIAIAAELRDRLARRFTLATQGVDASQDPTLQVSAGTMAAGQQAAFIRVIQDVPLGVDALGLTPRAYSPARIQVVLETSTIANVALMTEANKAALLGEIFSFGCTTEVYLVANTTAVSVAGIAAANRVLTFDPNLKYKNLASS